MDLRALGRARIAAAIAGLWIVLCAPAAAAQSVSITPVTVGDFPAVVLDGTSKSRTAPIDPFTVTDSSLVSDGWRITVSGTTFQRWDGASYLAGNPFPAGSLRLPQVAVAPQDTLAVPPLIAPGPYLIDGASVNIATAAPATGSGAYDFSYAGPLQLTVPASAYEGTYRAEITVSVASGP